MLLPQRGDLTGDQPALPPWLRRLGAALDYVAMVMLGLAIIVLALLFCLMNTEILARSLFGLSRSEEPTSELQSLMRISYAVFCLHNNTTHTSFIAAPDCFSTPQ